MTIGIWDKSRLWIDSKVSNAPFRHDEKFKIISPNVVVFGSGNLKNVKRVFDSITSPDSTSPNTMSKDRSDAFDCIMVIREDDEFQLRYVDNGLHWNPLPNQILILGSGRDYAEGALKAGASSFRAMEIACELDERCGGIITEVAWNGERFVVANRSRPQWKDLSFC